MPELLDWVVAVGTVGAAIAATAAAYVATRIAKKDRNAADERASDDRTAAAERLAEQRAHGSLRHRLDHLLKVAEAYEWERALQGTPHQTNTGMSGGELDRRRADCVLRARLTASADPLRVMQAGVGGREPSLAALNDVAQRYRSHLPEELRDAPPAELRHHADVVTPAELYGVIGEVRMALLGEPAQ